MKALDLAKYIVTLAYKEDKPVSNLKLQYMLFLIWVEYYEKTGEFCFLDNFEAWSLGPVIPNVYYEFCTYAGVQICKKYDIEISTQCNNPIFIFLSINKYIDLSTYELNRHVTRKSGAWDMTYNYFREPKGRISFDRIISYEVLGRINS